MLVLCACVWEFVVERGNRWRVESLRFAMRFCWCCRASCTSAPACWVSQLAKNVRVISRLFNCSISAIMLKVIILSLFLVVF